MTMKGYKNTDSRKRVPAVCYDNESICYMRDDA